MCFREPWSMTKVVPKEERSVTWGHLFLSAPKLHWLQFAKRLRVEGYLRIYPGMQFGKRPRISWRTQAWPCMVLFSNMQRSQQLTTKKETIYINFLSLLSGTFHKAGAFTDFLLQLHAVTPSSVERPWRCAAYCDEVHPGNILHSTSRKSWCIYISFLEFNRFLSKSDCWFCVAISRSQEVGTFAAGISQLFRIVLEDIFASGVPETGVLLTSPKGSLRLHFTLSMILQDGAAQKSVWASRQDTGSKPCFLCKNLFQLRDASTLEAGGGNVFSQFLKHDQLQIAEGPHCCHPATAINHLLLNMVEMLVGRVDDHEPTKSAPFRALRCRRSKHPKTSCT